LTLPLLPARIAAIQKESKAVKTRATRQAHILTVDELALVDHWNNAAPILHQDPRDKLHSRNLPTPAKTNARQCANLRTAVRRFGVQQIRRYLDQYFSACERGEQFAGNRNMAYKNLHGFCDRLVRSTEDAPVWWLNDDQVEVNRDPDHAATMAFANAYAKRFLGSDKYPGVPKSIDYRSFVKARQETHKIAERYKIELKHASQLMFDCAAANFPGTIYPAHLANHKFLTLSLPQYLKREFDEA